MVQEFSVQKAVFCQYVSDKATTNISIPQFLLYIHPKCTIYDLPKVSHRLDFFLFADDTALVQSHIDFDTLVTKFNTELIKVNNGLTRKKIKGLLDYLLSSFIYLFIFFLFFYLLVSNRKSSPNIQRQLYVLIDVIE